MGLLSFLSAHDSTAAVGGIDLDALRHGVAGLWAVEPAGHPVDRNWLRSELQRLDDEVEHLALLASTGEYVPAAATRRCAAWYAELRRRWSGDGLAA